MKEYRTVIKYFVAYYGEEKAYSYHADTNKFFPYSPIYRHTYDNLDQARAAARYARHHNKGKRKYIFIDSMARIEPCY